MTRAPQSTMYHRFIGFHAPALRRLQIAAAVGLVVGLVLARFVPAPVAVLSGWDACAVTVLAAAWHVILMSDGAQTKQLAMREDETRGSARVLLVTASFASLSAVGFLLGAAGKQEGGQRVLYIAISAATVVVSWAVVNTVFTLRYADIYYAGLPEAIDFGIAVPADDPDYRDFAYLAFTIGMTYQVSDTSLRDRRVRRLVLQHAIISYVFGVVIVSTAVSLVANLVR